MISFLFASAVIAAAPAPPAAGAPVAAPAAATPASPTPPPATTAPQSVDAILQGLSALGQTTDTEEDSGAAPGPASPPQSGPTPYDQLDAKLYDKAILDLAAAARSRSGPLEGGWTLAGGDGQALYRFRFVDRGLGYGLAEGAWRDLNGGPRLKGSGFISLIGYDGGQLTLSFYETGPDDPVIVSLRPASDGNWSGTLVRKGAARPILFKRE